MGTEGETVTIDHFAEAERLLALADDSDYLHAEALRTTWNMSQTMSDVTSLLQDRILRKADIHARLADIEARTERTTT